MDDCSRAAVAKGVCLMHYKRQRRLSQRPALFCSKCGKRLGPKAKKGICTICQQAHIVRGRTCVLCGGPIRPQNRLGVCTPCRTSPKHGQAFRKLMNVARREWLRVWSRNRNRKLKTETIQAYGGKCVCCEEERMEFLTLDHPNGGGKRHRAQSPGRGSSFYSWLKQQHYPTGLRVLCQNCNFSRGVYGYCPHEGQYSFGDVSMVESRGRMPPWAQTST